MFRQLGFVVALGLLTYSTASMSSAQCRKCDVVDEGLLNDSLVGQYVYEQGESGKFYRELVVRVRTYPPAIYRQILDGSYAWNDASHFYSESSMNEIMAASNSYQITTADKRDLAAQGIACATFKKALDEGSFFTAYVMRGACCDSTVAKRFGAPRFCR